MKYDSLKKVECMTKESDSVQVKSKLKTERKKFNALNLVIGNLAICIVASFAFMLYSIFTNYPSQSISEIFQSILTIGSSINV